jgi:uncharacterized membrane protein
MATWEKTGTFLTARLIWSLITHDPGHSFFLTCLLIAGIYGSLKAMSFLLWIQALPANMAPVSATPLPISVVRK